MKKIALLIALSILAYAIFLNVYVKKKEQKTEVVVPEHK